mmetsp:Transcript_17196/g.66927  ORF Transcript_17196/g.66927 Transcript_17196/m.66927 type:complete len:289 (-) Transcript_17196:258-1124(-)
MSTTLQSTRMAFMGLATVTVSLRILPSLGGAVFVSSHLWLPFDLWYILTQAAVVTCAQLSGRVMPELLFFLPRTASTLPKLLPDDTAKSEGSAVPCAAVISAFSSPELQSVRNWRMRPEELSLRSFDAFCEDRARNWEAGVVSSGSFSALVSRLAIVTNPGGGSSGRTFFAGGKRGLSPSLGRLVAVSAILIAPGPKSVVGAAAACDRRLMIVSRRWSVFSTGSGLVAGTVDAGKSSESIAEMSAAIEGSTANSYSPSFPSAPAAVAVAPSPESVSCSCSGDSLKSLE